MASEVDLHPDVVRAITHFKNTPLGRKYDRFAKKQYGISGARLAGKTVAGEFGGRSTRTGRGVVSSAGARGPAQFISSTRAAYIKQYGVDPWAGDRQAIKGMMLHHLNTGVEGYNPGMPTYKNYILNQRLNREDRRALEGGGGSLTFPGRQSTNVSLERQTTPGVSMQPQRDAARRELLLSGEINLERLLAYKASINSMQDVRPRTTTAIKVARRRGQPIKVRETDPGLRAAAPTGKGGIYEVFYDPLNKYWDSGGVQQGAIGNHRDHVHLSADASYILAASRLARQLGLNVGENEAFGGVGRGHTKDSFHYQSEKVRGRLVSKAIDVSGDPAAMRRFARIMMEEARRGRGR